MSGVYGMQPAGVPVLHCTSLQLHVHKSASVVTTAEVKKQVKYVYLDSI